MGGTSEEREVSLKSGKAIAGALREFGHDVVEVDLLVEDIEPIKAVAPEESPTMLDIDQLLQDSIFRQFDRSALRYHAQIHHFVEFEPSEIQEQ